MFTTGDRSTWLIVDKAEVVGAAGDKHYANQEINILLSSISCTQA